MAKVLITGSTGMIGRGVLIECIACPDIKSITLINRSAIDVEHEKIDEIILKDFNDISSIKNQVGNIDACFHCMGVSAIGMSEEQYTLLTFDVTKKLADMCFALNPLMTFNYVSGTGTDSNESGNQMWARVKGKTENYILRKGFPKAIMFRPGAIIPEKGTRSRVKLYNTIYTIFRPFFPLMKKMDSITTTTKIGYAMLYTLKNINLPNVHPENKAINKMAENYEKEFLEGSRR